MEDNALCSSQHIIKKSDIFWASAKEVCYQSHCSRFSFSRQSRAPQRDSSVSHCYVSFIVCMPLTWMGCFNDLFLWCSCLDLVQICGVLEGAFICINRPAVILWHQLVTRGHLEYAGRPNGYRYFHINTLHYRKNDCEFTNINRKIRLCSEKYLKYYLPL